MNIEIANRLVNLRKTNNLSQEALTEKLGISRQAVSKWERAEASPDTDNLILLARLYGVSLDELLKTEDEIEVPDTLMLEPLSENEYAEQEHIDQNGIHTKREKHNNGWFPRRHYFPMWAVISLLYILIGVIWNAWHPGWLLFFLVPIWHSLVEAFYKKNPNCFAYPVFATLVFLCLGFLASAGIPAGWSF